MIVSTLARLLAKGCRGTDVAVAGGREGHEAEVAEITGDGKVAVKRRTPPASKG
jgi:hypothetical protein